VVKLKIGKNAFIAHNATLIGDITIGDNVAIMYGAVLRGDQNYIKVGDGSNIQDNAVIHCDGENPTEIGRNVSVGHLAIVHGAKIGDNVIIGMGSIVMSGAEVEAGSVIGGGAVVTEKMKIPKKCIAVGVPAKVIRCGDDVEEYAIRNAIIYQRLKYLHASGEFERYIID